MSWVTFEDDPSGVVLVTLLVPVFFFISPMFPSGKLGDGPPNPFLFSFEYAREGEIQNEDTNFHNRMTKKNNMILGTKLIRPKNSIYDHLGALAFDLYISNSISKQ